MLGGFILAATEYERRFIDGGETHMDAIHDAKKDRSKCYDIQGRRISTPSRGIQIVDGRKYVDED